MKIAFFSDIHGNGYVLDDFSRQVREQNIDRLVFCGDVFGYYYQQNDILDAFRAMPNLFCLKGNHDQAFLDLLDGKLSPETAHPFYVNSFRLVHQSVSRENLDFVRGWPTSWRQRVDGLNLAAFHGSPDNPLMGRIYPDTPLPDTACFAPYDYVILGHSHYKMERAAAGCTVLNPGSIGQQRDGKGCSFLVLDTQTRRHAFHTVSYDIARLKADVETREPDNTALIEVLYRQA